MCVYICTYETENLYKEKNSVGAMIQISCNLLENISFPQKRMSLQFCVYELKIDGHMQNILHAFVMNKIPLSASFFLCSGWEDNSQTVISASLLPPPIICHLFSSPIESSSETLLSTWGLMPGATNSQMAFNAPLTEGCNRESERERERLSKLWCY